MRTGDTREFEQGRLLHSIAILNFGIVPTRAAFGKTSMRNKSVPPRKHSASPLHSSTDRCRRNHPCLF
jgi:hypothetical protein